MRGRKFDDEGKPFPTCGECGKTCDTFEQAQLRLCAWCGPGSLKAQGKPIEGQIVHSCKDCARILELWTEVQNGLCWLCGPGSEKWMKREMEKQAAGREPNRANDVQPMKLLKGE